MTDDGRVLNTIIQAGYLKEKISILDTLVSEAIVHLGSHGIRVAATDPATVAMHNPIEIHPEGFEHVPEGSFALGINLQRLDDYLSKANQSDLVNLAFKPETRMLNLQYGHVDVDIACIDPDSIRQEPDTSELDLPNQFTVDTTDLADAIDMADYVSGHITVSCRPDDGEVAIYADGDTDDVEWVFESDDFYDPTKLTEPTESKFGIEYLDRITGAMPAGEVSVSTGEEFPTILEYEFADGHGSVETTIAPRIDTS